LETIHQLARPRNRIRTPPHPEGEQFHFGAAISPNEKWLSTLKGGYDVLSARINLFL
jgi:hypothetical protein